MRHISTRERLVDIQKADRDRDPDKRNVEECMRHISTRERLVDIQKADRDRGGK